MCNRHPPILAEADAPDANRDGPDAAIPEWLVHALALIIWFLCSYLPHYRNRSVPDWWAYREDLPLGSAQQLAASIRGEFGNAIVWMCRRRGIGPGHPDWPELARAIVAYGGSIAGFRPGLPACGLQWWENPDLVPGMIGMPAATPAADAMASLLARQADAPAQACAYAAAPIGVPASPGPVGSPVSRRPGSARAATGPPTGPPAVSITASLHACANGAGARPAPPH